MIIVTGGAGFIGSNLIEAFNKKGIQDILVVDHLRKGLKVKNLTNKGFVDCLDKVEFRRLITQGEFPYKAEAIFHQGACSDTTETDADYLMDNNFNYSKLLLHYALERKIPFIYASSAAVYGCAKNFQEDSKENEVPLNLYGVSKLLFDNYVRTLLPSIKSTVVGLRYFNVYGPYEQHKGKMASIIYQLYKQFMNSNEINLFEGTDGFDHGEQRRDFIHVDDVVNANLFFLKHAFKNGIYNVGTGKSRSFNDVANIILSIKKTGKINYIPFPPSLRGKYQSFTEANIFNLRNSGFNEPLQSLESGIPQTLAYYQAAI